MQGRNLLLAGILLLVAGIALMMVSMGSGDSTAGIFLIIPYFSTTSPLGALGGLLMIVGIFLAFIGWAGRDYEIVGFGGLGDLGDDDDGRPQGSRGRPSGGRPRKVPLEGKGGGGAAGRSGGRKPGGIRGGAVVFIGPIPIVVGSDASMTKVLMIMGGVLMVVMVVVYVFLWVV